MVGRWLFFLAAALVLESCTPAPSLRARGRPQGSPKIRVLLSMGREDLEISASGAFNVETRSGLLLLRSPRAKTLSIAADPPRLTVRAGPGGEGVVAEGGVRIIPAEGSLLTFKGLSYPGIFEIAFVDEKLLGLINTLPLDEYLSGVIPHEIGKLGPEAFAALQAQAVAARTYALFKMAERQGGQFDVFATVQDQVYLGKGGAYLLATAAVEQTRGLVLLSGDQLARAYYSSACGGHTSDISSVWPKKRSAPYLRGILDRNPYSMRAFCSGTRFFRWRYWFSGKELGDILRATLPSVLGVRREAVGSLVDLKAEKRSRSGRVGVLVVETTGGRFEVRGDSIRWVLAVDAGKGMILPSTMFRLEKVMEGGRLAFLSIVGGGNGHGVGLCQSGAIAMARKGYTYEMILRHYYPGTRIGRCY